ncbi:MAG: hypothetical protein HND53_14405 [Proteobacteria bacterium]|nr:hypothetical protein [Pseudomonadota bacterium]
MLVPKQLHVPEITEEIETFLLELNASDKLSGLTDKLIKRNQNSYGQRTWQRYYPVDVDFSLFVNNIKCTKNTGAFPQKRPPGLQRVIMHFRIKTTKGHEYDYKVPMQSCNPPLN